MRTTFADSVSSLFRQLSDGTAHAEAKWNLFKSNVASSAARHVGGNNSVRRIMTKSNLVGGDRR